MNNSETVLKIQNEEFKRFGLTISFTKTKTIVFNVNESLMESKSLFTIENNKISNERALTYLGHTITNLNNNGSLIARRIGRAQAAFGSTKSMFSDRRIFLSTRVKIFEACVRSRLTYGIVNAFGMKCDLTNLSCANSFVQESLVAFGIYV